MKRTIRLMMALALVVLATSACKTKQKITEIPGANIEAVDNNSSTSTAVSKPEVYQSAVSESEVTRNENFNLAAGETNLDALKYKYHVVVGSFSKQDNARGLQSTLNSEGNKSVVVVNEKGMFRVLIASFNEYSQARTRISQITSRFPDAWVLVRK